MIIFPAIDIKDGRCVRLVKGDFNQITSYEKSPFDQAKVYFENGFNNIHIVDLDGALQGKSYNSQIVKKISGLNETLNEFVLVKKKPILGICVGMQLFAKTGYESQETKGFGWIDGEVRKINNMNKKLKLPHMGWNEIELRKDCFLFSNIKNKSHMYFIHSYEFMTKQKDCVVATTNYGNSIIVSVAKENIVGTQFHPEKSQKNGLVILENFLKWEL